MKMLRLACVVALLALPPIAARAVDTLPSSDAPDLSAVRVQIKAKDFAGAAGALKSMVDRGVLHPDVYSLLGFSLRKSGDTKNAQTYYAKALEFDPDHKGALEYQGEMFVESGNFVQARKNLERLVKLCPHGCEEREDLEKALAAAPKVN